MVILDLLLIQVIIIYCIGMSGFPEEITSKIHSWLTNGRNDEPFMIKPIFCEKCCFFWVGLIYIIVMKEFTLFNIFLVTILTAFTHIAKDILQTLCNVILKIILKIDNIIK